MPPSRRTIFERVMVPITEIIGNKQIALLILVSNCLKTDLLICKVERVNEWLIEIK